MRFLQKGMLKGGVKMKKLAKWFWEFVVVINFFFAIPVVGGNVTSFKTGALAVALMTLTVVGVSKLGWWDV